MKLSDCFLLAWYMVEDVRDLLFTLPGEEMMMKLGFLSIKKRQAQVPLFVLKNNLHLDVLKVKETKFAK